MTTASFDAFLVQAKLGTLNILTADVQRSFKPRVSKFNMPGANGSYTNIHGRESYVDRVVALLTVPEVAQLESIAMDPKPVTWAHPLLPGFVGRVEDIGEPVQGGPLQGYLSVSFSVTEHREINNQGTKTLPRATTPAGAQAAAGALWAGLDADVGDLPDWPDDLSDLDIDSVTDAFDDLGNAFDGLDSAFSAIVDGVGAVADLTSALDVFTDVADVFVDAARTVEDAIGDVAGAIISAPGAIVGAVRDCVDELAASAQSTAEIFTTAPTDLASVLSGFGLSQDLLEAVMEENGLTDPFSIPVGFRVVLPLVSDV